MKKYAAALLMVIAVFALGWAIVTTTRSAQIIGGLKSGTTAPGAQPKAREDALRHVRLLDQALTQIDGLRLGSTPVPSAPLAQAAPPAPTAPPAPAQPTRATDGQGAKEASNVPRPLPPSVISLVYISPTMQVAVIDGEMFGVGDTLPERGRVVEIGHDRIVVEARDGRRTTLSIPEQVLGTVSKSTTRR
jgi:hypothetical protein